MRDLSEIKKTQDGYRTQGTIISVYEIHCNLNELLKNIFFPLLKMYSNIKAEMCVPVPLH
jgi:hypothetical protein